MLPRLCALLSIGLMLLQSAYASPLRSPGPFSERVHQTQIDATLNTDTHRVNAQMTLVWTNTSDQTLTNIPFHLYLNAFAHTQTTFIQESNGGQLRNDAREGDDQDNFGYVLVTALSDASGNDLMPNWKMDDDIADLTLPAPLAPGESVTLNFSFVSQLPKVYARSGHNGDTFNFVAQWFPKPGVFFNGQWNNHRYHANSEYFADFGNYDVRLTAPSEFVVGATGVLVEKTEQDGNTTHHYMAEDVHDFVWVADSKFGEASTEYEGITIRLLYQPPLDEESVQNQLDAAAATFRWFHEHVGYYPHSTMTLVQPPEDADGASGMEYPTLVTTITNLDKSPFQEMAAMVTIHEVGHNYWQGIMASNEFEESWLDEGINSYTEGRIMAESFGQPYAFHIGPLNVSMPYGHHLATMGARVTDPVNTPSWEYATTGAYGLNSYSKPATILATAERIWGVEKMDRVLKGYYQAFSFKHPTTQDFLSVAATVDEDMAKFLDNALNTLQTIDLRAYRMSSDKADSRGGFDLTSDPANPTFTAPEETDSWQHSVTLLREGELMVPGVNVNLVYADGHVETRYWQMTPDKAWEKWQWRTDSELVEVLVDPQFSVLLDGNFANNNKITGENSKQAWRWVQSMFISMQSAVSLLMAW